MSLQECNEVSAAEAAKKLVLIRIMELGGDVRGESFRKIRELLGFTEEDLSVSTLRSALWKLQHDDGVLRPIVLRDWEGCDPRCTPQVVLRIYQTVRS